LGAASLPNASSLVTPALKSLSAHRSDETQRGIRHLLGHAPAEQYTNRAHAGMAVVLLLAAMDCIDLFGDLSRCMLHWGLRPWMPSNSRDAILVAAMPRQNEPFAFPEFGGNGYAPPILCLRLADS